MAPIGMCAGGSQVDRWPEPQNGNCHRWWLGLLSVTFAHVYSPGIVTSVEAERFPLGFPGDCLCLNEKE